MKIMLDEDGNYLEVKENKKGTVDLSIRTTNGEKSSIIITANLTYDKLDSLLTHLITLKGRNLK